MDYDSGSTKSRSSHAVLPKLTHVAAMKDLFEESIHQSHGRIILGKVAITGY